MDHENSSTRKYELKKRADTMAETRRRIAEAAVDLHGTVGPARTTLSAVAKQAGVQRHTVYRHFPTEADLFGACSAHFFGEHPVPDLETWPEIKDPRERLGLALDDVYAYYEQTEPMFTNVMRDVELIDALRPTLVPMHGYLADATEILSVGWGARGRRRRILAGALRHGLDFRTWQSLTADDRITRAEAVELTIALVEAAAGPRPQATA